MHLLDFNAQHFSIVRSWFSSEADVVQWGGPAVSFPLSDDQLRAMVAEGETVPPGRRCWMVEHRGDIIGHAQLGHDWHHGNAVLSRVAIAPAARGSGLSRPLVTRVVDQAFRSPQIYRVELNVYSWNLPAIRSYEGIGFVREGLRRASVRVGDARWDTVIMGLLRHEWTSPARSRG
ncbi:MAG: GNAT family N-acetyltransferase [Gammaproteobacteria bacterium]|jgi:RimJ/RimL family protein N-acetyltransferase|nr:GNAT family N-acetyltransferase [Gammaproteobacteria bacterium]